MKKILIYLGDYQEKKSKLKKVLDSTQIPYHFLCDNDLNCTIKDLLENNHHLSQSTNDHCSIDLMFLDNISDEEIALLNDKLKKIDISMPRKAMRTEHNEKWLLKDLLNEIEKEHNYFIVLQKINEILQKSSSLIIENYTAESWNNYERAFFQAYHVLQNQSDYDTALFSLKQLLNAKYNLTLRK